jgi:hypothetical protein
MAHRRRNALKDDLMVWGFMLSFAGLMVLTCVLVFKYVALVPSAFETSTSSWSNPMDRSGDDYPASASLRRQMTPRERYQSEENAGNRDR